MSEKIQGLVLDGEEWLTVTMAAEVIGLTQAAVYKAIERERLPVRVILDLQTVAMRDVVGLWPQAEPLDEQKMGEEQTMEYSEELRAKIDALTPRQKRELLAFVGVIKPRTPYFELDDDAKQVIALVWEEIEQAVMGDRAAPTAAEEATP